ncbi:Cyclophilin-like peptidyl-prolyl cis-trans isomerase family protein isoform 1 [Tripterygium wilfordii]|uniref:Peptidyl-prolyl cis-trans isomerase n=1 Tax=Tripterygium wilfordii TaxID=458696 RepID=A0A7J7DHV3_TRIWF|nr:peptidyl-prolyl cis-trans isomerase CYP21-4-like [Tripterygium wilfordii]KAF5745932.1 Cyclophilin-like peptidyl-prolyl cis-trans isomerase family protein isoform 1 [Tripterygium wilfordii]
MARIKPQALLQQSKKKKVPSQISVTTILLYSLIVVLIVFSLFATYRHWSQRSRNQRELGESGFEDENRLTGSKKYNPPEYAIINTSKGPITVELFKDSSPEVVAEFIDSCQKGHFKGMLFHHVMKHVVIRAGSVNNLGAPEEWTLRGKRDSHLDTSSKHGAFMLGTSKTKHDSKGFELFITTAPLPILNEKLTVFGRVIKGDDVVQEIEEVDTNEHYQPKSPVGINNVTLKLKI